MNTPIVVGSDTVGPETVQRYLAGVLGFTSRGGEVFCSYVVVGQEGEEVYMATLCEELVATADSLASGSGRGGPVALVLDTLAAPVRIARHVVPRDGGFHAQDIRRIFPAAVQRRILSNTSEHNRQVNGLQAANREAAAAYFARPGPSTRSSAQEPCVAATPADESGRRIVSVYFPCEASGAVPGQLYAAFRSVAADAEPVEVALRQLVRGPTPAERARGLRSHFSVRTADIVLHVARSSRGDTAIVDFAADLPKRLPSTPDVRSFLPPGAPAEITWTVFSQFPEVKALRLRLDGSESAFWRWLGGEPRPFTRLDWERI